jgi:hypothetical protein
MSRFSAFVLPLCLPQGGEPNKGFRELDERSLTSEADEIPQHGKKGEED